MKKQTLIFILTIAGTLLTSCSDMKQKMKDKVMDKMENLAEKLEEKERQKDAADLKQVEKELAGQKIKMVPPPAGSLMSQCPELPSAADLVAGNTDEFVKKVGELRRQNRKEYDHMSDSVARNRQQLETFGHTQAELDGMNEEEKASTVAKALQKQKEKQAKSIEAYKEAMKEVEKAQEDGIIGSLKTIDKAEEQKKQLEKQTRETFFKTNKELVAKIDAYKARKKKFEEWIYNRETELSERLNAVKGEARAELWRSYYTEVQQRYHALLPEAEETDRLCLQLQMPGTTFRGLSDYRWMNVYYLNWQYFDFVETITQKHY